MATVSKSFTAVGVSSTLRVDAVGETVTFNLSGTYAATITFEMATSFDESAWEVVPGSNPAGYSTANATVAFSYVTKRAKTKFRTRCIAFTSGTAVTSVADADLTVKTQTDPAGNVLEVITQAGRSFVGNLFRRFTPNSSDLPVWCNLYSAVAASTAISNTVTETLFDNGTATIPANTLRAGSRLKIRMQGIATATNATDTLAIKVYINGKTGTLLFTVAATDVANNDVFQGEYDLVIRTIGASGTIVGCGTFKSIPAAEGTMTIKDDILASTTLDTTAAVTLDVSATWSVANAGNSCRLDFCSVELAL